MLYPKIVDVLREENARLRAGRDAALVHGPEDLIRALEESRAEVERLRSIVKGVHGALTDSATVVVPGSLDADLYAPVMQLVAERDEWRDTARSEMAGRAAAEAEVERLRDHLLKASEANGTQIRSLKAEVERLRAALEIIAGKRQCLDNLMSNVDVAHAALAEVKP